MRAGEGLKMALDKRYEPGGIEPKWSGHWEASGAFRCGQRLDAETYCIVMPPPNVTGSLHLGHALDCTIQDILIRFERLRGKDVLWQPGMDHAGIATQMVVERQLDAEGLNRRDMGREAFVDRVWKWKEESGGAITRQLRRLGASCDWSRERFTMDEGFIRVVQKKFVSLYDQDLIYRDKRLVNWDPGLQTAVSDLEVEQKETDGHYWHFRYPIEGEEERFVVVATTRPETMLGDTAVAVHPDDKRYADIIGKHVILPLVGRRIPIVTDEWADPVQGSGAVKITPAHDFNDFEVGKRHGLEMVNIFDQDAVLNDAAPEAYRGLDRFEARKRIIADMEALGLVEKIEPHAHTVPTGDRSGVPIEPWLTDQWYVAAEVLAKEAIAAVEDGRTKLVPKTWEKTYFEWMRNIQPWCVSRQLWWGHRIPAWYAEDGSIFVAESEDQAYEQARAKLGSDVTLTQDEDVLDTWFSSALWPFGTLGWPEDTPELARFYPNSTLVTSFDIIFFWVARMMMDGLHFMGEVPFRTVYIHALIRDEHGQKMSKSKGNVIDPLEFSDKYGADALRFTLASMEAQGRDIKLAKSRIEGYRNFATKLWNAARFCEMNGCTGGAGDFDPTAANSTLNKWIVGETTLAAGRVTTALEAFKFNEAADAIYHFTWGTFCDWYLELAKPALQGEDSSEKTETRRTTAWVLDQILTLLHPFMPFITEELWHAMVEERSSDLILGVWPELPEGLVDEAAAADIEWVIRMVSEIRSARAELNVPGGAKIPALVRDAGEVTLGRLARHGGLVQRLARLESMEASDAEPGEGDAQLVVNEATVVLQLAGAVDFAEERARLQKSIDRSDKEIKALSGRLKNQQYRDKAPAHVVAEAEARLAKEEAAKAKHAVALERLG